MDERTDLIGGELGDEPSRRSGEPDRRSDEPYRRSGELDRPDGERRRAVRRPLPRPVRLARAEELPLPAAELVDASTSGFLLRVAGRHAHANVGDRLLVSVDLAGQACHLIGEVRRVDLGHDGCAYVGIELTVVHETDACLLARELCHATFASHRS